MHEASEDKSRDCTRGGGGRPSATPRLERTSFVTDRALEFFSQKELAAQTGHDRASWPLVVARELIDNSLDAAEEAGVAPEITVEVDGSGITVFDNGSGIPGETINQILDFNVRVSSREVYVAPDRGAQGNALKTLIGISYVLDGHEGKVEIATQGVRHQISVRLDQVSQQPVIDHKSKPDSHVKNGTSVYLRWSDSAHAQFLLTPSSGSYK